jgi:hypothetical protein
MMIDDYDLSDWNIDNHDFNLFNVGNIDIPQFDNFWFKAKLTSRFHFFCYISKIQKI